jgi:LysR family glycine cleavage system transcriptional activator
MKRRLPSLPSLRAFESAARHLSFKVAADELCVTQSAISHQVKILEDFLEAPLFIRYPQRVELTLRGSEYLEMVSLLLDGLESATKKVEGGGYRGSLFVQASPAFLSFWLLPRLIRFNRIYPDIEVNLSPIAEADAPAKHPFDLRVNCAFEVPPDIGGERFMDSPHVPVCSPKLLQQGPRILEVEDLFQYPILQAEGKWNLWDRWFDGIGFSSSPKLNGPHLANTYLTTQAAEEGLGIALAPIAMIREKIDLGRLVVVLDQMCAPALYYTLSCADGWQRQPRILAFREWLNDELGDCSGMDMSSYQIAASVR